MNNLKQLSSNLYLEVSDFVITIYYITVPTKLMMKTGCHSISFFIDIYYFISYLQRIPLFNS